MALLLFKIVQKRGLLGRGSKESKAADERGCMCCFTYMLMTIYKKFCTSSMAFTASFKVFIPVDGGSRSYLLFIIFTLTLFFLWNE